LGKKVDENAFTICLASKALLYHISYDKKQVGLVLSNGVGDTSKTPKVCFIRLIVE
jgi:hypothetical protein